MVFSADSRFQGLGHLALRFRVPEVEFRVSGVQMGLREISCTFHFLRSPAHSLIMIKGFPKLSPHHRPRLPECKSLKLQGFKPSSPQPTPNPRKSGDEGHISLSPAP